MAGHDAKRAELSRRREPPSPGRSDLGSKATYDIAGHMNSMLADVLALYLKTKNFQWHLSGPHFRDYQRMLAAQAVQLLGMIDPIAERIRKLGRTTLRSIGHIAQLQRVMDNDADYVAPQDMLTELKEDNQILGWRLRQVHLFVKEHYDVATASLIQTWIDETEERTWFLFEAGYPPRPQQDIRVTAFGGPTIGTMKCL